MCKYGFNILQGCIYSFIYIFIYIIIDIGIIDTFVRNIYAPRLASGSLNNEFFGRACESWRCRLGAGEFTHDSQTKMRAEAEKDRMKLDPWKVGGDNGWGAGVVSSRVAERVAMGGKEGVGGTIIFVSNKW